MFKKIFTLITLLVTITVGVNSFGVITKAQEYPDNLYAFDIGLFSDELYGNVYELPYSEMDEKDPNPITPIPPYEPPPIPPVVIATGTLPSEDLESSTVFTNDYELISYLNSEDPSVIGATSPTPAVAPDCQIQYMAIDGVWYNWGEIINEKCSSSKATGKYNQCVALALICQKVSK